MFYKGGILYKHDTVLGHPVEQLCLPEPRRLEAFRLAHDTCHLGAEKVLQRLRMTFAWPLMRRQVRKLHERCGVCQGKRRVTYLDRTPITPVPRAEVPFMHIFADCFGPLFPDKEGPKPRYNYGLVVVDQTTRFAFCEPLTNLSAKQVCESFLNIFSLIGVPAQISTDNGSNFTARLTQEFMAKLGCSPRFSQPMHPQGVGLSERVVGSIK